MRRYVLENPMPQYPEAALKAGGHGEVVIAVIFKEDGTLEKAAVLASTHPEIARSVLETLKNWKTGRYFVGPEADPLREVRWLSLDFEIVDGKGQVGYAKRGPDGTKIDKRYLLRLPETALARSGTSTRQATTKPAHLAPGRTGAPVLVCL